MKNSKIFGFAVVALAAFAAAAPARAQVSSAPIVVQQTPPKKVWLHASVIHADGQTMMVQDAKNPLMMYTFSYAPEIRDQMQKLADSGGFQYGDRVKILHKDGDTVVIALRGRPSKPL